MQRLRHHLHERIQLRLQILSLLPAAGTRLLAGTVALQLFTGLAPVAFGRIAEAGTHEQLVAAGGIYADLYSVQAAGYR